MTNIEKELCQYSDMKKHIRELELKLDELLEKKEGSLSRMLRCKEERQGDCSQYESAMDVAAKFADLYQKRAQRIADDLKNAFDKLNDLDGLLNRSNLSETELRYVRLRYFKGLPLFRVEQELGYSERHTRRIRHGMLKKLEANR